MTTERRTPTVTYYTATTLDGFLADQNDSLDWLLRQDQDKRGPQNYDDFIEKIGAIVMGSTTYAWILAHLERTGEPWFYSQPSWVMSTRDLPRFPGADIRFAAGSVADVYADLRAAAGESGIWVIGGGDLAGQFADAGLLDEVIVSIAPVTLGAGRPLLPRRLDLRLVETAASGAFVTARFDVVGPLQEDRAPTGD
ncbi:dihydrofolate reductase family protein [Agromyces sp. H66]|uniref:dihydrofolate reductase family protein n=1 Tax=Agromyces sp. H66 TaxID=2529859 RepID=UPI0010AB3157|nr:dihydrofolate reductase family protein [Agromyces sp. H66]